MAGSKGTGLMERLTPSNTFMVVSVKPEEWKRKLVIPIPMFLVEEILNLWPFCTKMFKQFAPEHYKETMGQVPVDLDMTVKEVRRLWRTLRRAGSFTLVEVKQDEVEVKVSLY